MTSLSRCHLLAAAAGATATWTLAACESSGSDSDDPSSRSSPTASGAASTNSGGGGALIVYFSRAGENYDRDSRRQSGNGRPISDLAVGNTEVLAKILADMLGCPTHKLEPAEPYPHSYDATVAQNVAEYERQARPAIANPLTSIARYSTLLIGSPIWATRAPRIMRTFIDAVQFEGVTVAPFVTHAGSEMGGVPDEYAETCRGARAITDGLAVRGEEVRDSREAASAWLRQIGLA